MGGFTLGLNPKEGRASVGKQTFSLALALLANLIIKLQFLQFELQNGQTIPYWKHCLNFWKNNLPKQPCRAYTRARLAFYIRALGLARRVTYSTKHAHACLLKVWTAQPVYSRYIQPIPNVHGFFYYLPRFIKARSSPIPRLSQFQSCSTWWSQTYVLETIQLKQSN